MLFLLVYQIEWPGWYTVGIGFGICFCLLFYVNSVRAELELTLLWPFRSTDRNFSTPSTGGR